MEAKKPTVEYYTINQDNDGQRLDNFLISTLKGLPKSRIYNLIRRDEIRVNKKRVHHKVHLQAGDIVRVAPIRLSPSTKIVDNIKTKKYQIVYEDSNIIAIDKPSGLAVHGGSGVSLGLIEQLRIQYNQNRLQLGHRLDRETSGLIVVCKSRKSLLEFQRLLNERKIKKYYLAIVEGVWQQQHKVENAKLKTIVLPNKKRLTVVSQDGREAISKITKLQQFESFSLLKIQLVTGRMHQIRVHCQYNNAPIIGDSTYNSNSQIHSKNMLLHAFSIELNSPLLGNLRLKTAIPNSFDQFVKAKTGRDHCIGALRI